MGALVRGYCSIIDIYDGFIAIKLEHGREHIIPSASLIDLIRNARDTEKLSDGWDWKKGGWYL